MPYIPQEKRDRLDPAIAQLHEALVKLEADDETNNFEGNVNYTVTRLLRLCYSDSYADINAAIGALECIKLEHYRTKAVPYETQKMYDNGDVTPELTPIVLDEMVIQQEIDSP